MSADEFYTLSLHDALPICLSDVLQAGDGNLPSVKDLSARGDLFLNRSDSSLFTECRSKYSRRVSKATLPKHVCRSEEHTSELQSHSDLVCRLLLEKKKYITCVGPTPTPVTPPREKATPARHIDSAPEPTRYPMGIQSAPGERPGHVRYCGCAPLAA